MLHCAILGSVERFLGILIEHTAGAFPAWLAPLQAIVIPVSVERHGDYAALVASRLKTAGIRAEMDAGKECMAAKIREAELQKISYMLVVGGRECADETVAVRVRSGASLGAMAIEALIERIRVEIPTPALLE